MGWTVGAVVDKLLLLVQYVSVAIVAALLLVMLVPFARERLQDWVGLDSATMVGALVALCVPLLFWSIREVARDVRMLAADARPARTPPVDGGVGAIYPYLHEAIVNVDASRRTRRLRILGLTLNTSWSHLNSWINTGDLTGWEIEMVSISPAVAAASAHMPADWSEEAAIQVRRIHAARDQCEAADVSLAHAHYEVIPSIHGFEVADEVLFVSHVPWSPSGHIGLPYEFYEIIRRHEDEVRYRLYRRLFDQWFAASRHET